MSITKGAVEWHDHVHVKYFVFLIWQLIKTVLKRHWEQYNWPAIGGGSPLCCLCPLVIAGEKPSCHWGKTNIQNLMLKISCHLYNVWMALTVFASVTLPYSSSPLLSVMVSWSDIRPIRICSPLADLETIVFF